MSTNHLPRTTAESDSTAPTVNVEPCEVVLGVAPRLLPGSNRCQCAACGRFFASPTAFDKHQRFANGEARCLGDDEMRDRGMIVGATGWWFATPKKWVLA